jgi:hypothetical protein
VCPQPFVDDDSIYDVFLSYNSADVQIIVAIAERLRNLHVRPWLDRWHLTPGGRWPAEIAAALRRSKACAVFISPHDISGWGSLEATTAVDLAATNPSFRVFPVLLPGIEKLKPETLPPFLSVQNWVDMRSGPLSASCMQGDWSGPRRGELIASRRWRSWRGVCGPSSVV